ncbi:phosphoesterase PA-phosphatase [Cryptosporangium japonicum]|uniref:Phosphatase PAP2 family protein n=1 Tax=Cryptosporangium japonicum TaxID=80872 RepID=A0ABP3EUZ4_9ACTN
MDRDATDDDARHHGGSAYRFAQFLGVVLAPGLLVSVQPFIVALDHDGEGTLGERIVWAAVILLSCAIGPLTIREIWILRGKVTSGRRVHNRAERLAPLTVALGVVAAGVAALQLGHAPPDLRALVWAMLVGLAVTRVVTSAWKISVHAAVTAGTVTILVLVGGPSALLATPLIPLVAWSRVKTSAHTVAQVIGGAIMGAGVAYSVFTTLT